MEKEDILAKSRKENRDKDLFKAEVNTKAATIASITASLLATVFFVVQILVCDERSLQNSSVFRETRLALSKPDSLIQRRNWR